MVIQPLKRSSGNYVRHCFGWRPHPLKSRTRRQHAGGIALHEGSARRRYTASQLLMLQNPHRHRLAKVTAVSHERLPVPGGGGGARTGTKTTRRTRHQRPGPTGVEGAGGIGGPGCGARGRWRGLAGLRDDAPSEARGADGERAGRRPRAHKVARPTHSKGPEAPQRLGPHTRVCQLLTG